MLFECRSESDQSKLLDLNGSKMGGKKIHVVRGSVRMSISEAFSYIKRKLGTAEEVKRYEVDVPIRTVQQNFEQLEEFDEEYDLDQRSHLLPSLVGPVRTVQHAPALPSRGSQPQGKGAGPRNNAPH